MFCSLPIDDISYTLGDAESSNVNGPSSITSIKWTPVFEWHVIRYGSKNEHQKTHVQ